MSRLAVQFLDESFHRVLFNAMPMPVFVVDDDVTILEYNSAAAQLLGPRKKTVLARRGGEVLNCVHATESPDGCGRSAVCSDCVVRNAVRAAAKGRRVTRKDTWMELVSGKKRAKVNVRVSTLPINYHEHSFVLLILEGLNG